MGQWYAVAKTKDIRPGEVKRVELQGKEIGIYEVDGEYYAISDICSHEYARLSEGEFYPDEYLVECPLHGSQFDIRTGRPRSLPAVRPVPVYQIRVNGDDLEIYLD